MSSPSDPSAPDDLSATPGGGDDTLEDLLARAVAAPPSYPGLEPDTVVSDRYVIERLLGMGGMGAVYLAHDRSLGRAVALKLHRTTADADRLRREARAMARLAHPNVVTVFEVGELDRRPFVAMEYVEGHTLRAWLAERGRTRREILSALLAAGEGLHAAHEAGLVHRDVKPDNILVGRDGRVRVGDFGLAQLGHREAGPVRVPIGPDTATGTVLGTPAYMAPEQIDGGQVDARTDQFAFCLLAWEALAGERPFTGADTLALRAAIERGVVRPPRRHVPARFRRILLRGMACDPAARWPSMRVLLDALRATRGRPRRVAAGATVIACAGVLAAWGWWPAHDPVAACASAISELDRELPVATTAALVEAVRATASGHAVERATMIAAAIDGMRARARVVTQASCRARASRQWSPELAAASHECRAFAARTARELLVTTPVSPATISDLVQIASRLPEVESCGDARVLAGWRPLAPAPGLLDAVVTARARLENAIIQLELGRLSIATATLAAVRSASVAGVPAVRGRTELLHALTQIATGDYPGGEQRLAEAYFAARADDDGELALRIVGELIQVTGNIRRDRETSERWILHGIADAQRERDRQPIGAASVYLAAAAAASIAGDSEVALERAAVAEQLLGERVASLGRGAVYSVRTNAYADLGHWSEALASSQQQIDLVRASHGDRHPAVAEALGERASLLLDANRGPEAAEAARQAKAIIDGEGQVSSTTLAAIEISLGASLISLGDPSAQTYLERARASWVAAYGEDHADVALIDSNLALLYLDAGDTPRALAALRHAVAVQERVLGADHPELAAALYNLAVAERESRELPAALVTARRVAAIYTQRQPGSVRHVYALGHIAMIQNLAGDPAAALRSAEVVLALPAGMGDVMGLAWAQLEAARALIAQRTDLPRARTLLTAARAGYAELELPDRLTEIDGLLARAR